MNYTQALEYLSSLPDMERGTYGARGPNMPLSTVVDILDKLGNPHIGPKTIHITGSKGKGSTAYMLAHILKEAKIKTALYTSPHLSSYLERFQIDLNPISPELFAKTLTDIQPILDNELTNNNFALSTFGVLTIMFFYMVKNYTPIIDCQIIEVGVGGRYDATNVFPSKDISIITPISLEHSEILGNTPSEIASNKAGIITKSCTTILAPQRDSSVASVIARRCYEVGSDFIDFAKKYKITPISNSTEMQSFELKKAKPSEDDQTFTFTTPMLGQHQSINASVAAIAAMEFKNKGVKISTDNIVEGIKKAKISGRLEILKVNLSNPKQSATLVVDGAHNQESANCLAKSLKDLFPDSNFIFVLGVNNDKNIHAIWKELNTLAKYIVVTKSQNLRSMDLSTIKEVVAFFGQSEQQIFTGDTVKEATEKAIALSTDKDIICVTGSLYVVAEALEFTTSLNNLKV